MVKFAHLADCHIGGWRDEKLRNLNFESFTYAIDKCISENVDFVLISGDLFNTSLPGIELLKNTVRELNKLKENNIRVYTISGSHDFSPSGKTMLSVLEEAGLIIDVVKMEFVDNKIKLNFVQDVKTKVKITGIIGKKGMLETTIYNNLIYDNLEKEQGFKIFMFHTAITELKPKELENMGSLSLSLLPKGFNYYAGGHVHIVKEFNLEGYNNVIYPGPTFPNNFYELEQLKQGSFYIYDNGDVKLIPIEIKKVISINLDCNDLSVDEIETNLKDEISNNHFEDTIVTIKLKGILRTGKSSDINFKEIFNLIYSKNAFFVMKNTFQLRNKQFEEIQVQENSVEDVENSLIQEHAGQNQELNLENEVEFTKKLMVALSDEKIEDEKNDDYDQRIINSISRIVEDN